jgi:hypothetical protein
MTTIAMVTLTQVEATLLAAITTAATPAATASVGAISPGSSNGRRCFLATTAAANSTLFPLVAGARAVQWFNESRAPVINTRDRQRQAAVPSHSSLIICASGVGGFDCAPMPWRPKTTAGVDNSAGGGRC